MRILNRAVVAAALAVSAVVALAVPAQADTINFVRQSSNASQDVASQLSVDLTHETVGGVTTFSFRFLNNVGIDSSLTQIYFRDDFGDVFEFDDPTPTITDSGDGVAFAQDATPPDPPGPFGTGWNSLSFSLDADAQGGGAANNGVDSSSEWVQVDIELLGTATIQQVLELVDTTGLTGSVLALHVQSIGTESDWFYNEGMSAPSTIVPEPASIALLALGLGGLFYQRRRRLHIHAS